MFTWIFKEVAEHKTKRDVSIHKKMLTDVAQDFYFKMHGMRLIRVQNLSVKQITPIAMKRMGLLP